MNGRLSTTVTFGRCRAVRLYYVVQYYIANFLQLCLAKGFICEYCKDGDDVIFPFQLNRVVQCSGWVLILLHFISCFLPDFLS